MSKEAKIIIFAIITMAMNILAPILMINLYKGYTAESFIVGSPDKSVVITEYVEPKDYLYQENLSSLTFVQEDEYWVASYNFEDREFNIEKTYAIFVNDYICTPVDVLGSKVSGTHTIKFNDINMNTLDITKMSIDFEFYTTYSSILLKVETADITYFNGFKQNPGFILTLTEIDPNLLEIVKNTTITITPEEPDENVVAVTFKSYDDSVLNTYYVEVGNTLSTTPDEPTREDYLFTGWSDGTSNYSDVSTLTFEEDTTLTTQYVSVYEAKVEQPTAVYSSIKGFVGSGIWTDGTNIYSSFGSKHSVFDKATHTWGQKIWYGLTEFYGSYIWTDGTNIYYSKNTEQYVLNKETSTWVEKTWNGLTEFEGNFIWTDGTEIYYSYHFDHFVLDKDTSTWTSKTWNGLSLFDYGFYGSDVWTDGDNYYYSYSSDQYVLDIETSTWTEKTWNGLTIFNGAFVWTAGGEIYYSYTSNHYLLDKETSTWSTCDYFNGFKFQGCYNWTDGQFIYTVNFDTTVSAENLIILVKYNATVSWLHLSSDDLEYRLEIVSATDSKGQSIDYSMAEVISCNVGDTIRFKSSVYKKNRPYLTSISGCDITLVEKTDEYSIFDVEITGQSVVIDCGLLRKEEITNVGLAA